MLKFGRLTRELTVKELTGLFKSNDSLIIANFQQVDANKIQQLKKPLKASSTKFKIVKNSMARIAVKNANMEFLMPLFEGTCVVGFSDRDGFLAASKVLVNFSKENEGFKICGGCLKREFVSTNKIKELALLPSREVLLARAIGVIKSPISGFVGVLNNVINGFVRVVDEISKKKQ